MGNNMTDNLQKLLDAIHNDKVYIQTHNFPDPDAIASAYGLQQLLGSQGVVSTICYEGKNILPENIRLFWRD